MRGTRWSCGVRSRSSSRCSEGIWSDSAAGITSAAEQLAEAGGAGGPGRIERLRGRPAAERARWAVRDNDLNESAPDRTLLTEVPTSLEAPLAQQSVKQRVIEAVEALPADATIEDAMERLYFLAKIQRGLEQADSGDTLTHQEAKERLLK